MPKTSEYQLLVEAALASGHLWARMSHGRYWQVRRNGQTKTWKTYPGRFSIPVKGGLRSCAYVTDKSKVYLVDGIRRGTEFLICQHDPNKPPKRCAHCGLAPCACGEQERTAPLG
jgi:hypothetical protein